MMVSNRPEGRKPEDHADMVNKIKPGACPVLIEKAYYMYYM
jgi:hypothetical protein